MYIDDHVIIQNRTNLISLTGKLVVKKFSVIASGCTIIPSSHQVTVGIPFFLTAKSHINDKNTEIIINEDCWIGASCILLPGCEVGRGVIVGAGTIITKNIPPYAVVVGNPCKIIASKFTKEQIIEHERHLYPANERLSLEYLDCLFDKYYQGMRTIGISGISSKDKLEVLEHLNKWNITDYYENE